MAYDRFKKIAQLREQLSINDIMSHWLPKGLKRFEPSLRTNNYQNFCIFDKISKTK